VTYSPGRRTAVVLCGTGAHGAYHAGVLRALEEAGVKVDVMAGQGVGGAAAALAAIDGAARLWEADGIWRGTAVRRFYRWRGSVRAAVILACVLAGVGAVAPMLEAAGLASGAIEWAVAPVAVIAALGIVLALAGAAADPRAGVRRRATARRWRIIGAPLDAAGIRTAFAAALWGLIRGASQVDLLDRAVLGRRYAEVLADSLGQPGFRELMIVATDLDGRRDLVAALLREPHNRQFIAARPGRERRSESVDLAGDGRDHLFDVIGAALTPPVICDPYPMTFGVDSYWRGETHRVCDRPGACIRLLEELSAAGVSQAIVVSAVPTPPVPHRLTAWRLDPRHRLGDFMSAAEAAALRDTVELARLRFEAVYVIRPAHNPVGPFDLGGAYDEASDRRQNLAELMDRAYEDAYRQFIEPVIGASGERLAPAAPERT
jgi:Patatin-like phospholipase